MKPQLQRIIDHCQIMIINGGKPTADDLKDFARDLDRQLRTMVTDAHGDGSYIIECVESAMDLAFQHQVGSNESFDIVMVKNEYGFEKII